MPKKELKPSAKPALSQIKKVFIACPSNRWLNPWVSNALAYNLWLLGVARIEVVYPRTYDEYPLSVSRNIICKEFLESKSDFLFMYDDDTVLQPTTIYQLLQHNLPIVSAFYLSRKGTGAIVVMKRLTNRPFCNIEKFNDYRSYKIEEFFGLSQKNGLVEVDAIGGGCLLIKRDALLKLKEPYFLEWSAHMPANIHRFGEDLWMSERFAEAKIPIRVDTHQFVGYVGWAVLDRRHLQEFHRIEQLIKQQEKIKNKQIKDRKGS